MNKTTSFPCPATPIGRALSMAAVLSAIASASASAGGAPGAQAGGAAGAVASCIGSATSIWSAADSRVELDANDARIVAAAIVARYPVIGNDGLTPQRLLLAKRAGGAWLYVALRADAGRPGGVCSTASFVAERFELTPALLRKYFGLDA